MSHHHRSAQDRPDWVHDALAGDVWRGAMDRFEKATACLRIDIGGGRDAHPPDELRREVGQDVTEQVAGHDDVELARVLDELHRSGVDEQMTRLRLWVLCGDRLPALLPE